MRKDDETRGIRPPFRQWTHPVRMNVTMFIAPPLSSGGDFCKHCACTETNQQEVGGWVMRANDGRKFHPCIHIHIHTYIHEIKQLSATLKTLKEISSSPFAVLNFIPNSRFVSTATNPSMVERIFSPGKRPRPNRRYQLLNTKQRRA